MKRASYIEFQIASNAELLWRLAYQIDDGSMYPATDELVTVVVPVFNCENTIRRALDSVLAQIDCKVEIIVIDDGSSDSTPAILKSYGDSITVITQPNQGSAKLGKTRNTAAAKGSGRWIAFLDADDYWHPRKIALQLRAAKSTASNFIFTGARSIGDSGDVTEFAYQGLGRPQGDTFKSLLWDNFIFTSSVLLSRDVFESIGGFSDSAKVVEDWDLWLRLASHGAKFCGIPDPLIAYEWRRGSASKAHESMRARRLGVLENALTTTPLKGISSFYRRKVRSNVECTSAWFLARDNPRSATSWYFRAFLLWPFNIQALKGVVKGLLA
jgi:glycosyltransferase involved in cell wall biosynthesis